MRLRRFAGLVAVLAVLGGAAVPARAVDPKLLPNDTEFFVTINIQQILKSELVKNHKDLIDQAKAAMDAKLAEKGADKILAKTGFDFFRDLASVTMASSGSTDPEAGFILVDGNFAWDKLKATALEESKNQGKGLKVVTVAGSEAFEITGDGEKTFYAGLIAPKSMAVTLKKESYQEAAGRGAGTKSSNPKAEFKKLMGTVSDKQSFAFVATGAALIRMIENAPIPNGEQAATFLQQIEGITASLTIEKAVGFQLSVAAKDQATAEQLAKMANGGLSFVRAMAKKKAEDDPKAQVAVDVANTLRITSSGSNVVLRGEISGENIAVILKNIPKR